jgi:hypothetical protein
MLQKTDKSHTLKLNKYHFKISIDGVIHFTQYTFLTRPETIVIL